MPKVRQKPVKTHYVQDIIAGLQSFWAKRGCAILQPLDQPVGAGTFHPATTLRALGPDHWNAVYVQPSRRPTDGRHGRHPNRLQRYYQLQVVQKPSPDDFQDAYLRSLEGLGIKAREHDIRFVEDDWKSPTLGAWGLGWEVWCDGMEITQFTYFQEVGGLRCKPVMGEITYGIERLAMYLQGCDNVYDIMWNEHLSYADLHLRDEEQFSTYNYGEAGCDFDTASLREEMDSSLARAGKLLDHKLPLPAYEAVLACSHLFNVLDARRMFSVNERTKTIADIRRQACAVAKEFLAQQGRASK